MKAKTLIYICTDEECIYGVFSSPQKAEDFCRDHLPFSRIEVWELDTPTSQTEDPTSIHFFIKMSAEGKITEFTRNVEIPVDIEHTYMTDLQGNLYVYCKAETEEQALKLAEESRQQLFSEGLHFYTYTKTKEKEFPKGENS